jgi:hypothetical protein
MLLLVLGVATGVLLMGALRPSYDEGYVRGYSVGYDAGYAKALRDHEIGQPGPPGFPGLPR